MVLELKPSLLVVLVVGLVVAAVVEADADEFMLVLMWLTAELFMFLELLSGPATNCCDGDGNKIALICAGGGNNLIVVTLN